MTPVRLGVAGAVLTFMGLALLLVVVYPVFLSSDESHHVDYAWRVGHLELPKFEDGVDPEHGLPASRDQWTAQHPPLFYLLLAPIVTPPLDHHHWRIATLLARLVVTGIGALVVLSTAWAAAQVVGESDPLLVVGVGLVSAVVGELVSHSAAVYNDPLAVLASTLALGLCARMLRRGVTRRTLVGMVATCTAGFATRSSFLVIMLVVALGSAIAVARARRGASTARLLATAVGTAALVVGVPTLASEWFYARNQRLTGSWTGVETGLREHLGRTPRSLVDILTDASVWRRLFGGLLAQPGDPFNPSWVVDVIPIVVVLTVAALGLARLARAAVRRRWGHADLLVGGLLASAALGTLAQYVFNLRSLGGEHPRYILPALLPLAVGAVYGLRLSPRARGAGLLAFSVLGVGFVLGQSVRILERRRFGTTNWWDAWARGADLNGIPSFVILAPLATVAAGIALEALALWRLTASVHEGAGATVGEGASPLRSP